MQALAAKTDNRKEGVKLAYIICVNVCLRGIDGDVLVTHNFSSTYIGYFQVHLEPIRVKYTNYCKKRNPRGSIFKSKFDVFIVPNTTTNNIFLKFKLSRFSMN